MLFADKLYAAEKNNEVIAISDDISIVKAYSADNIRTIESITEQSAADADDLTLIENVENKEYGYSEIWKHDDEYSITLHQNRLIVDKSTYSEAATQLEELGKTYGDDGDSLRDIIGAHLDFWMRSHARNNVRSSADGTDIYAFKLTNEEITCLLRTGFRAENLLLIV